MQLYVHRPPSGFALSQIQMLTQGLAHPGPGSGFGIAPFLDMPNTHQSVYIHRCAFLSNELSEYGVFVGFFPLLDGALIGSDGIAIARYPTDVTTHDLISPFGSGNDIVLEA